MPSTLYPSQTLSTYRPLPGSACEMSTSTSLMELPRSPMFDDHVHSVRNMRRPNYYSNTEMYICCNCGDGPKVYNVQPILYLQLSTWVNQR
ncbi:hypothetical protein BDV18DRAFT_157661 [Aspergillus unguis]